MKKIGGFVLAVLLGFVLGVAGARLAGPGHGSDLVAKLRDADAQARALQGQVDRLRADLEAQGSRNAQLAESLSALERRYDALERTPAPPPKPELSSRAPGLRAALAEEDRERLRGPVEWLRKLWPKRFADLTAEELAFMRTLDLSDLDIAHADLEHLRHLDSLRTLDLRNTPVTDAGLLHLKNLAGLKDISLWGTKITDAGLEALTGLASLERLDLRVTAVTDAGLAPVGRMGSLKEINLLGSRISGTGLVHLRDLRSLETLILQQTPITDAGLASLPDLPSLRTLLLHATEVTDAGLPDVRYFRSLERLGIKQTKISDEWVARFQAAHPRCIVSR